MKNPFSRSNVRKSLDFMTQYNPRPNIRLSPSNGLLLTGLLVVVAVAVLSMLSITQRLEKQVSALNLNSQAMIATLQAQNILPQLTVVPPLIPADEPSAAFQLEIEAPSLVRLQEEEITILVRVIDNQNQPVPQLKLDVVNNTGYVGELSSTDIVTDDSGLATLKIKPLATGYLNFTVAVGQMSQQVIIGVEPAEIAYYVKSVPALSLIDDQSPYFADLHNIAAKTKVFLQSDRSIDVELANDVRVLKVSDDPISGLSIVIADVVVSSSVLSGLLPGDHKVLVGTKLRDVTTMDKVIFTLPGTHRQPVLLVQSEIAAGYSLVRIIAFVEDGNLQ